MKRQISAIASLLIVCAAVQARADMTFTDTIDLIANPPDAALVDIDGVLVAGFGYEHLNPAETTAGGPFTPAQYEAAVADGRVTGASIEITMDDFDLGELGGVLIIDRFGNIQPLGDLNTMSFADVGGVDPGPGNADASHIVTTSFDLDPDWLDGLPVGILFLVDSLIDEFEIEASSLSVSVVPLPGALMLAAVGLGLVGCVRRFTH